MSMLLGLIKFAEARLNDSCQVAQLEQNAIDAKLENARQLNVFNAQLLKRLVIDSRSDPALSDLLERHNVTVIASSSRQNGIGTPAQPMVPGKGGAVPEVPSKP
jgi:hypothetical protein